MIPLTKQLKKLISYGFSIRRKMVWPSQHDIPPQEMPGVARPGDISKNHLEYMTQLDATGNGPSRRYRLSGIICTMGKKSLLIPPRKVQLLVFCCCLRLSTVRAQHIQFSSNKS
ncbi:uncharacterized protein LOC120352614 isoform X3 [Nilaparvata lugens]|uniref:uncharacterized protein LOC120352614 isoform X3 n=1 Tax=Nilaparvata lugens TaxID=108931 RepID=UPI00193D326A|nr:uncharacterized protein LOC120352614 isoform X3 [Nilaparvata lugens]